MKVLPIKLLRPARALAAGCLAGLCALAFDQALAFLILGFPVPITPRYVVAYAATGALAAACLVVGSWLRRHRVPGGWTSFAVAAAGVYAPAVFERVHHALSHRAAPVLAVTAAVLALACYGLWIIALARVAGRRARGLAPLLGAAGAAIGLAVNRSLVNYPLEPAALAADAAVLTAAVALAYLGRRRGTRRVLVAAAALALGAVVIGVAGHRRTPPPTAGAVAGERPPNLVLVIIDTLRQDTFRNVVRRTEEGRAFRRAMGGAAWFSRAIAAAPWTVPSVGSIMTGLYPQEHGLQGTAVKDPSRPLTPLAESVSTLAEKLRLRGYRTEAIGTNPLLQPVSGIARGFDNYEILSGPTVKLPLLTVLAKLGWLRKDYYQQASSVGHRLRRRLGRITALERPVFLWLHLMDPHSPLHSHPGLTPDPRAAGLDQMRRLYRDEVRYTLRELTSMFEQLRAHGLWQNTALVVVSDHGEMFPSDGHKTGVKTLGGDKQKLYGHGHAMYGELVRVPLVIRPPGGLPQYRRVKALTSHVDLHDTILDLLGADASRAGGDRVSLAPWLGSELPESGLRGRDHVLIGANQHGPKQRALRTHRFKLIEYPRSRHRQSELYLISSDPGEREDVAGTMKDQLAKVQQTMDAAWERLSAAPATGPAELDAETLERLKALGYLP